MWWTSAVKLFCKFFPTTTTEKQLVFLVILMSPKFTDTVAVRVAI
jgi:hypothetical protein